MRLWKLVGICIVVIAVVVTTVLQGQKTNAISKGAMPRYDLQAKLAPFQGDQVLSFHIVYMSKSQLVRVADEKNPFKVRKLLNAFEHAYTTDPELIKEGRTMKSISSGTGVQFSFFHRGHIEKVWIDSYSDLDLAYGSDVSDTLVQSILDADSFHR